MTWYTIWEQFNLGEYLSGLSICSQEQEEDSLPTSYSGTELSEHVRSIRMQEKSCYKDNETAVYPYSQSTEMYETSMEESGEDQLISSQEDSPVRISVPQVQEQDLKESVRAYGLSLKDSLTNLGLHMRLSKTPHASGHVDSIKCSKDFPRWGIMQDGVFSEVGMSVHLTGGTDSGYWLTPTVQDGNKATKRWRKDRQNNLTAQVFTPERYPVPSDEDIDKSRHLNPEWVEKLMGWPKDWTSLEKSVYDNFMTWKYVHLYGDVVTNWLDDTNKTTTMGGDRVLRLQMLGNGQVPLCASTAFRLLSLGIPTGINYDRSR